MSRKRLLVIVGLCFSLGFGFTASMPTAHACTCPSDDQLLLELQGIDGDGELATQQSFWRPTAWLGFRSDVLVFVMRGDNADTIRLEVEPRP